MTTQPPAATPLSDADYHARTHAVLAAVEAAVDRLLDADVIDIDPRRTGGLLELKFPQGATIVVNTQPPLHELWLAAPGGGYHFRFVDGRWIEREGREFFAVLDACAAAIAGRAVPFTPAAA